MKRLLRVLLALAICSAALCAAAAAADAPLKISGKVSSWNGEGILLKNEETSSYLNEVALHVGDAPAVDAATGLPLDLESVKEGDTLYAWIGPAATMSLPPRVYAEVVVGNVPEGASVPEYYEIAGAAQSGGNGTTGFPVLGGGTLTVTDKTEYNPWMTRQIVQAEDLVPGARALVWADRDGRAEKVIVFAYDYRGYAAWGGDKTVFFNGQALTVPGRVEKNPETGEDLVYLPLRAVAEAAGYDVSWDRNRGAVVQTVIPGEDVELVFYAVPGEQVIFRNGGETGITGPCILEKGVTYLPAADLCYWLNVFFAS